MDYGYNITVNVVRSVPRFGIIQDFLRLSDRQNYAPTVNLEGGNRLCSELTSLRSVRERRSMASERE